MRTEDLFPTTDLCYHVRMIWSEISRNPRSSINQVYGSTETVASALRGKAVGRNANGRLLQNSRWQGMVVPTIDDLGESVGSHQWHKHESWFPFLATYTQHHHLQISYTELRKSLCKTYLNRTQAGPGRAAKEQHKQTSPNHVPGFRVK